jgi:hypothetical protein
MTVTYTLRNFLLISKLWFSFKTNNNCDISLQTYTHPYIKMYSIWVETTFEIFI